jgi:hypothetical protein
MATITSTEAHIEGALTNPGAPPLPIHDTVWATTSSATAPVASTRSIVDLDWGNSHIRGKSIMRK